MEIMQLENLGLTVSQAKAYLSLVKSRSLTPPELAVQIKESRTNSYKILDRLVELGLAEKTDKNKRLAYSAKNPIILEELARQKRDAVLASERQIKDQMPALLNYFFTFSEQPGVRFYKGKDQLKDIYFDQINTGEPIYIIRPDYNMDIYDFDYMTEIRHMARRAGIKRYAITPDRAKAPKNYKESDPFMLLDRTWLPAGDYTAPVEWNAYGNILAVMSFGTEAIGMIIESPQIAEAFRQLYYLLEAGLKLRPGYGLLPKHANYIGATDSKQYD